VEEEEEKEEGRARRHQSGRDGESGTMRWKNKRRWAAGPNRFSGDQPCNMVFVYRNKAKLFIYSVYVVMKHTPERYCV